ncbi:hypothetical protein FIBSPDRAFT_895253 [Athelia psychrophila]|uniref:Uncharacterized protein n=1 Tax=Athelia psychrophila TaxID=1759441 RepID=A0A166EXJ5_9AGAM|nr:hypothetical protein FIBSPDRAFT_895253 [Fibularhizoctonia sp. CBS 109695]
MAWLDAPSTGGGGGGGGGIVFRLRQWNLLDAELLRVHLLFSFGLPEDGGLLRCAELRATSGYGDCAGAGQVMEGVHSGVAGTTRRLRGAMSGKEAVDSPRPSAWLNWFSEGCPGRKRGRQVLIARVSAKEGESVMAIERTVHREGDSRGCLSLHRASGGRHQLSERLRWYGPRCGLSV